MSKKVIKSMDKLWHDLSISELQQANKGKSECDLSYHDTLYLNIIEAHPNGYTSSQIADLLKVSRPAVTQKINELIKRGYIIRTQSATDKRVFYLKTNPEKDYFNHNDRADEIKVVEALTDKFGNKDIDKFCEMIEFFSDELYRIKLGVKE